MMPNKRYTVNLAPADVKKEGSAFDLPIALGILTATGQVPIEPGMPQHPPVNLHRDLLVAVRPQVRLGLDP